MMRFAAILFAILLAALPVYAAEKTVEDILPGKFDGGWSMEEKAAVYTPQTLYKYIDGEAEMYMPYGFGRQRP